MSVLLDFGLTWIALAVGVVAFVYCCSIVSGRDGRSADDPEHSGRRGRTRPWGVAGFLLGRPKKLPDAEPPYDDSQVARVRAKRVDH